MRKTLALCLVSTGIILATAHADDLVFYVSPQGSDTWTGLLPEVAGNGTDGPFQTLERARDAVRMAKPGQPNTPMNVEVRGGTYYLTGPLLFTPEDSGSDAAPITYRAFGQEKPVICGGRVLTGWQLGKGPNGGKAWVLDIPQVKNREWTFSQLFAQRRGHAALERRYRPSRGMFAVAGLTYALAKKAARHRAAQDEFRFFSGDLQEWENMEDVELLALHCWSASRLKIRELNLEKNTVAFTGYPTFRIGHWWKDGRNPYYVENVKEELDAPGEWYLDRPTGRLYYMPRRGETLKNTDLIAPVSEQVITIQGDPKSGKAVTHLSFEGLAFAVSQWNVPAKGYGGSQAMPDLRAAIEFSYAEDCELRRCTVAHTGAYGVSLGMGCQRNQLVGLTIHDLGGGGIKVGDLRMSKDAKAPILPTGNVVANNLITNGGVMHFSANAIWAGIVKDTVIQHNEIRHFPYSGIAVGWSWSPKPTSCGGNRIEYNHIHHVVNLLGDGASIYTLGNQPGTVIRGNVLHDNIKSKFAPAPWQLAIYLDEGSAHIITENNLVYRVGTHAFNINGGRHNSTRNNIFGPTFDADRPFIRCYLRKHGAVGNTLTNNIMYWDGDVLVDSVWPTESCLGDSNVYWNFAGKEITFSGKTFSEWQEAGHGAHSIIADPRLANPAKDDFRVLDDSPAIPLGFKPFDPSLAGLQKAYQDLDTRTFAADAPPVYDMPVPLARPVKEIPFGLDLDCEEIPVGCIPREMSCNGANTNAHILVSDAAAKSGTKSLTFTDKAGLSRSFYPYIGYRREKKEGPLHLSFDVMNSATEPALLTVNVRDYDKSKATGQEFISAFAITVTDTGKLTANGRELATPPLGEWVHVDVRFETGANRADTFTLKLTLPDGSMTTHELPFEDTKFRTFSWLGFIADGDKDGTCHVDNLKLTP